MGHSNVQPQLQNITHETFACENPFVSRAQKIMEQELDKKTEQKKNKQQKHIASFGSGAGSWSIATRWWCTSTIYSSIHVWLYAY